MAAISTSAQTALAHRLSDTYTISSPALKDAELIYIEHYFEPAIADDLLAKLNHEIHFQAGEIKLFGRTTPIPRLQAWHGDPHLPYTYSNVTLNSLPWTDTLQVIKKQLEHDIQQSFNGVLCNLYRSGQDSMGWHSDNEPELGDQPLIASMSLGGERRFQMQHKKDKLLKWSQTLGHGSLLIMAGDTQHFWRHQLPKTRTEQLPRINLTFRTLINQGQKSFLT